jgi:sugar phosphate isomerase/epimerase
MRFAICNETFEGWPHARICEYAAELGYQGLELAPFTLASRITDVSAEQRTSLRKEAEACGLTILGLHWLLAKTNGLHLTSPDESVRTVTAAYLGELARCCSDLGGDILVFGSPAQRRIPPGHTHAQATEFALDTLRKAMPAVEAAGVRFCLEPLAPPEADLITTCAEGAALMDRVGSPAGYLHLDVRALSSEGIPVPELIHQNAARIGHFHANDPNKRGPGFGAVDFVPIFQALKEINYPGWVSVEVFDYSPDPETIARESLRYMRECAIHAGITL